MTENKQEICNLLLKTLQATRHFSDLAKLDYIPEDEVNTEYVEATFANGSLAVANVAMDSGIAMIRDILKQIT